MARPRTHRKHKQQASSGKEEGSPPKKQKPSEKGGKEKSSVIQFSGYPLMRLLFVCCTMPIENFIDYIFTNIYID